MLLVLVGALQGAVITNSSFTDGLTGWAKSGAGDAWQVSGGGPDGNGCVRLENSAGYPNFNTLTSDLFAIEPQINNLGYDFSIWIFRGGLGDWAKASVTIEWFGSNDQWLGWTMPVGELSGSVDWQQFSAHYASLPAGTAKAKVNLRLELAGWYAQFDNPAFAATTPEPATLALLGTGLVALLRRRA